jgi:hypothetical protein
VLVGQSWLQPTFSRLLEFLHFSSCSSVNQGLIGDLEAERSGQLWLLCHFSTEEGNKIQRRRPPGVSPPLGQLRICRFTLGSKGLQRRQQQGAVGGHGQDRLFGYGDGIPQLNLADAQSVLLFAVIDLDLPAVEIDLPLAIRSRRDDDEAQRQLLGAAA